MRNPFHGKSRQRAYEQAREREARQEVGDSRLLLPRLHTMATKLADSLRRAPSQPHELPPGSCVTLEGRLILPDGSEIFIGQEPD